jgi:alpha-tubulin suppressor-like RCC1 family protein
MVPSPAVGVSAAFNFTCALLNDSTVWCWGERGFCDASRQGEAAYLLPQSVGISDAKAVATGSCHACALKNDGSVWCWGSDYYGESGYGPGGDADAATWDTPRQVVELGNDVTFVAAGESHTCARKSDATIWCWGNSSWGQLGNNLVTNPSPIQMRGCE